MTTTPDSTPAETEREAVALVVPSEEAMFSLLDGLNMSGEHCELPCVDIGRHGSAPFLATLTDPDAAHVNYIASDESGYSRCVMDCEDCGSAGADNGWKPTYPVTALVGAWPDADRCAEDDIDAWWVAASSRSPRPSKAASCPECGHWVGGHDAKGCRTLNCRCAARPATEAERIASNVAAARAEYEALREADPRDPALPPLPTARPAMVSEQAVQAVLREHMWNASDESLCSCGWSPNAYWEDEDALVHAEKGDDPDPWEPIVVAFVAHQAAALPLLTAQPEVEEVANATESELHDALSAVLAQNCRTVLDESDHAAVLDAIVPAVMPLVRIRSSETGDAVRADERERVAQRIGAEKHRASKDGWHSAVDHLAAIARTAPAHDGSEEQA